ncbi:hypothetical protein RCG67_07465 [Kocuria sp. CPCC 205292]|uniref:hypothetical protein n=1 Tax=Kocuria cellulosilytica TaxID=3071451 RepID=UPI0034D62076
MRVDDLALAPGIEQMHGAEVIFSGFHFGMPTIAVLGALLITGEYATGMIRSTFAAVPARIPGLRAKEIVLVVLLALVIVHPVRWQREPVTARSSLGLHPRTLRRCP